MSIEIIQQRIMVLGLVILLGLTGCKKDDAIGNPDIADTVDRTTSSFTTYLIRRGNHYCDQNTLKSIRTSAMNFVVRFDSSAIYSTVLAANQYDINKLYGFSEGLNHQYNSARVGWRWSDNALRLFGYVYKTGTRYSQEICTIPIGTDITCSIKLNGYFYDITANGIKVSLPRASNSSSASGYQLYPYFGGDEVAPRDITIKIRNL
jgi:hypothetical protein